MFRLIATILLVASGSLGVAFIRGGAVPDKVLMPAFDLRDLPLELGRWKGEEVELDRRLFQALDAAVAIDRVYRDEENHAVMLHGAVFADHSVPAKHHPIECYPAAGYELLENKTVAIPIDDSQSVSAGLLRFQRDSANVQVLVYYQMGDKTFGTWGGGKTARRAFWGQPAWPAMVKVMLQDTAADTSASEARLTELAADVYRWMSRE